MAQYCLPNSSFGDLRGVGGVAEEAGSLDFDNEVDVDLFKFTDKVHRSHSDDFVTTKLVKPCANLSMSEDALFTVNPNRLNESGEHGRSQGPTQLRASTSGGAHHMPAGPPAQTLQSSFGNRGSSHHLSGPPWGVASPSFKGMAGKHPPISQLQHSLSHSEDGSNSGSDSALNRSNTASQKKPLPSSPLHKLHVAWNEQLLQVERDFQSKLDQLAVPEMSAQLLTSMETYRAETQQMVLDMMRDNRIHLENLVQQECSQMKRTLKKKFRTDLDTMTQDLKREQVTSGAERCDRNLHSLQTQVIAPLQDSSSQLIEQVKALHSIVTTNSSHLRDIEDRTQPQLSQHINNLDCSINTLKTCVDSLAQEVQGVKSNLNTVTLQMGTVMASQSQLDERVGGLEIKKPNPAHDCKADALAQRISDLEIRLTTEANKWDHQTLAAKTEEVMSRHTAIHPPGATGHGSGHTSNRRTPLSRYPKENRNSHFRHSYDRREGHADSLDRERPHPRTPLRDNFNDVTYPHHHQAEFELTPYHEHPSVPNQYGPEIYSPILSGAPPASATPLVATPRRNVHTRDPAFSPSAITIESFTGRVGEWGNWFHKFSSLALNCGWTDQEKLVKLTAALKGNALITHRNLPIHVTADFSALIEALQTRFGKQDGASMAAIRASLADMSQNVHEDTATFADRILGTVLEGYPSSYSTVQLQQIAVEYFIRGCRDTEAARLVFSTQEPTTISEAVSMMKKAQAGTACFRRLNSRMVTFEDPPEVMRLDLSNNGRCGECNSPNHWARECPERSPVCDICHSSRCDGSCDDDPPRDRRRSSRRDYCDNCGSSRCDGYCDEDLPREKRRRSQRAHCDRCEDDRCDGDCHYRRRRHSSTSHRRSSDVGPPRRRESSPYHRGSPYPGRDQSECADDGDCQTSADTSDGRPDSTDRRAPPSSSENRDTQSSLNSYRGSR